MISKKFNGVPGQASSTPGGPLEIIEDINALMKATNDGFATLGVTFEDDGTPDTSGATSVKNVGDETIAGVKTFSSSPVVPVTPTTDAQVTSKVYVDDIEDALQIEIDLKSDATHNHTGVYEPANANIQTHISSSTNPHVVTKSQLGLANVDNTSDINKPISTATQTALDLKSDATHNHTGVYEPINANIQTHIASTANPHTVTKTQLGLANIDNTSDVDKPISTATQVALDDLDSRKLDIVTGEGTIPATGWIANTGDYNLKTNIAIDNVSDTSWVDIETALDSSDIVSVAEISPTLNEYVGGITLYANYSPTESIPFKYKIIKPSVLLEGLYVTDYFEVGDADYTAAINRAHTQLAIDGGGRLIFPDGDYKITPGSIFIPEDTEWYGLGAARVYTEETTTYNVLISTTNNTSNITINNIIFDQRGDVAQVPQTSTPYKGCFLLHIPNTDNVSIKNCTFYTYGICAALVQSFDTSTKTEYVEFLSNKAYFQRKVDAIYDVSVFNVDGGTIKVNDNYVEALLTTGFSYSEPRTAIETHSPEGEILRNTTKHSELGLLHLGYPVNWASYNASDIGDVSIKDNVGSNHIIGINLWSDALVTNSGNENVTVEDNTIGLTLDANNVPARGISLSDESGLSTGYFNNITIKNNDITFHTEFDSSAVYAAMAYVIPTYGAGGIHANFEISGVSDLVVTGNTITNFPYTAINICNRISNVMTGIEVKNNVFTNANLIHGYGTDYNSIFNFQNINGLDVTDNESITTSGSILSQYEEHNTILNKTYLRNTF